MVRAVDAQSVTRAFAQSVDETMEDGAAAARQAQARGLLVFGVEQAEIDRRRGFGMEREIAAVFAQREAEFVGRSEGDGVFFAFRQCAPRLLGGRNLDSSLRGA